MAGYICHLWLDVIWVRDVYLPGFGPEAKWLTMRDRLLYHNILRAWCDQQDQSKLNGDHRTQFSRRSAARLAALHLRSIFDPVARPAGRSISTGRQHPHGRSLRSAQPRAPAEFQRLLESPQALEDNIFVHASQATIAAFYQHGHDQMAELISEYLREP